MSINFAQSSGKRAHVGRRVYLPQLRQAGVVASVGFKGKRPSIYFVRLDTGREVPILPENLESL